MISKLYNALNPYCENIRAVSNCLGFIQHFSGMFMVYDILKTGKTENISVGPILSNIVLCLFNLKFHFLTKDIVAAKIHVFGIFMNLFYLLMYYSFTSDDDTITIWNHVTIAGIILFGCLLWVEHEDQDKVEYRLGMLISGIILFLAGPPLLDIRQILTIKSIKGIRFPVVLLGLITSCVRILYGISKNDKFMIVLHGFFLTLNLTRISLFAIYPVSNNEVNNVSVRERNNSNRDRTSNN